MNGRSTSPKTARRAAPEAERSAPAGAAGIAATPPAYGIDVLDRGSDPGARLPNRTGLPDALKSGIEGLSGLSLDDVRVHYGSSKPAQLQALAYAQGNDIHLAPGQERSLPHEAWHVVQQKQGRVRPTLQAKGIDVNNDAALENEASLQGDRALRIQASHHAAALKPRISIAHPVVQRNGTAREDAAFFAKVRIQQIKPAGVSSMSFLYGTVAVRKRNGEYGRPIGLASAGEAMLEYISDNPDDPDGSATPVFKYGAEKAYIPGHPDAAMKDVVLGEIDAVMEFLEGKARVGGGGGLYQSNPEKRWVKLSPPPSKGQWPPLHSQYQSVPGWTSPDSYPAHGGSQQPQISTPGGTAMDWYASYSWDSPGGTAHSLHAYGMDVDEHQTPLMPLLQSTLGSPKLGKFTGTKKTATSQEVDQALLNAWAGQRKGFKPDQNAAMSSTSANTAAYESFGADVQSHEWQWLHLIAFTLGGDARNASNPNTPDNLVAGLAAANGHHLVIENLVKKLILGNKYKSIHIAATANMFQNSFHVASSIDYQLKGVPSGQTGYSAIAKFHIDTLDPSKSTGGDLLFLSPLF